MRTEKTEKDLLRHEFQEMFLNPEFISIVKKVFHEICYQRENRPKPKPGFYYKRDWYDIMLDNRNLSANYILKNGASVMLHESNITAQTRNIIKTIVKISIYEFLQQLHS